MHMGVTEKKKQVFLLTATVDNLYMYMYTDQIVSTYWVSSAQCIPNSQYIVTLDRMYVIISGCG